MLPPAPARFSTMTDLPYLLWSLTAIARARTSAVPPAENGTTIVIGRVGNDSCASAGAAGPKSTRSRLHIRAKANRRQVNMRGNCTEPSFVMPGERRYDGAECFDPPEVERSRHGNRAG